MLPNAGRCGVCGWLRGMVALTTKDGEAPSDDIVVKTLCPQCGAVHTHELVADDATAAKLQAHVVARFG